MRLADHYIILVGEHDRDYTITDLGHVNHSILAQEYHHNFKRIKTEKSVMPCIATKA